MGVDKMLYRIQQKYDIDHLLFPNLYRLSCPENGKPTIIWLFDKYKKPGDTYQEIEEMKRLNRTFHWHAGADEHRLLQITNFYPILLAAIHCCYILPARDSEQYKAIKNFSPRSKFFQDCFSLRDDINVLRGYIFSRLNSFKDEETYDEITHQRRNLICDYMDFIIETKADWAFFQHYGYKTPFLDFSYDLEDCKKGANYNGEFDFNNYYLFEINETLYMDFMRVKGLSLEETGLYQSMYTSGDEMKNIPCQNQRIIDQKGVVIFIPPQGWKIIDKDSGIQTSGYIYHEFLEIFQDIEQNNFKLYPVKIYHIVYETRTETPRLSTEDLIKIKSLIT
jgi:hypothetical protein